MKRVRLIARLEIKGENVVKGIRMEGLRVVGKPEKLMNKYFREGIDEIIFYVSPKKLGKQAEYFYNGRKKINFFDNKQFDIVEEIQVGKDKKIILRKK